MATVVPKTGETVDLLDRKLFSDDDIASMHRDKSEDNGGVFGEPPPSEYEFPVAADDRTRRRTRPNWPPRTRPGRSRRAGRGRSGGGSPRRPPRRPAGPPAAGRSRGLSARQLGFEAIILAWAAWLFCRRDY